ncbi:MAG: phosphate acyltransferase, partial [Anaerolineales bacterium]
KAKFANDTEARTLADAIRGADVFYGLSVADVLTPEMVKTMAERPLIFAMANPDPEIKYEIAKAVRPDAIIATGRSDYPNQINNVLGFPYIFRGALDVRARAINDEMKLAAAHALAQLTREDVPDSVLRAYNLESLKFGPEYLIPTPFDHRVLLWVAPAVAKAAMETGAARTKIDIREYRERLAIRQSRGAKVRRYIMNKAQSASSRKRVVFGEGVEAPIIRAAARVALERIAAPILLGNPESIRQKIADLGLDYEPVIVDPRNFEQLDEYAQSYYQLRQRKGVTLREAARDMRQSRRMLGLMMVKMGVADAFIAGITYEYPEVLRLALRVHRTQAGVRRVAAANIIIVERRVFVFADVAVNVSPTAEELAEIAGMAADFARQLELNPRVALLSFSNFGSVPSPQSKRVRQAVELLRACRPDLSVDGEMQADIAIVGRIASERYPFSQVQDANVLIFPSLDAANIAYKLLTHLGDAKIIGPILLGMGAPVQVLDPSNDVDDIVNITAVAVMDAMSRDG